VESKRLFEAQLTYLEDRRGAGHGLRLDDAEIWFRQAQQYHFLMMNAWALGRYAEAQAYEERSPALAGKVGEYPKAHALRWLAVTLHASGAYTRAQQVLHEAMRILRTFGDSGNTALAFHTLGLLEFAVGRHQPARALFRRSLTTAEELGWAKLRVQALNGLAATALTLGQIGEAQRLYEESVALFERPGSGPGLYLASAVVGLGQVALAMHETDRAKGHFRQALNTTGRAAWETAQALAGMAQAIQQEGDLVYATELLACVESWPAAWHETRQQVTQVLRELAVQLPPNVFAAAVERGRSRQVDDVVAELVGG
jgi:tetratricopeptide (TPR) repeat protein